jgi:hypothetical protein
MIRTPKNVLVHYDAHTHKALTKRPETTAPNMFIFGAIVDQSVICALPISALRACIQVTVFLVHINGSQRLHSYKVLLSSYNVLLLSTTDYLSHDHSKD